MKCDLGTFPWYTCDSHRSLDLGAIKGPYRVLFLRAVVPYLVVVLKVLTIWKNWPLLSFPLTDMFLLMPVSQQESDGTPCKTSKQLGCRQTTANRMATQDISLGSTQLSGKIPSGQTVNASSVVNKSQVGRAWGSITLVPFLLPLPALLSLSGIPTPPGISVQHFVACRNSVTSGLHKLAYFPMRWKSGGMGSLPSAPASSEIDGNEEATKIRLLQQ